MLLETVAKDVVDGTGLVDDMGVDPQHSVVIGEEKSDIKASKRAYESMNLEFDFELGLATVSALSRNATMTQASERMWQ